MINVFTRATLFQDTNAEAAAAVWSKLREAGIKYEVATKTHTSSFKRMLTQNRNIHYNMGGVPASWMEHNPDYLYVIYVHKKDYANAKSLCDL